MSKQKTPTVPEPRKAIPCIASPDPDEVGRNYAAAITGPEVSAYRIIVACELPELTDQLDVPGMLLMLKDQADTSSGGACGTPKRCFWHKQRRCKPCLPD